MFEKVIVLLDTHSSLLATLTALAALFVSVLSIVLTVSALYIQRKHNYYSVRPIGVVEVSDYKDSLMVRIRNAGVGPMKIRKIKVTDQRTGVSHINLVMHFREHETCLHWARYSGDMTGRVISTEGNAFLFKCNGDPEDPIFLDAQRQIRNMLSHLEVKFYYSDIYNRKVGITKKTLTWFARHEDDRFKEIEAMKELSS